MIKIAGFIFIACLIVAYVLFATPSETTCVLQIQPYHVSTAVPLVVFHKNKTLSGLRVGEKATIGLEYIAEAGIPEVYANELRKHSDVLAAFSVADLIAGSNLLPAEHIEDTLSPMTLVLPHTTTKANYVSIIGMIIESNDAYALGTVSLKDTKIVEAIVYDAGTEKNAPCLSFLEDEQGAIGAGCPSLNSGQYDMIYNGTTTDELIHRHTTFTEPAFSITPQCTQSSIEENEFTIIPYFGISTKNKTETIAFDILRMPKDTFAIGIFHNDATAFAPQTLQTQLTTLFATGNSDTFVKSIQSIQQEVVVQVFNATTPHIPMLDAYAYFTVYFVDKRDETAIYHTSLPIPFVSRHIWGSLIALPLTISQESVLYDNTKLNPAFRIESVMTAVSATE